MWREIERLAGEERMTILITTHYMEEADRLASQLAIVDRGRIVVEGTPEPSSRARSRATRSRSSSRIAEDARRAPRSSGSTGVDEVTLDGATLRARARDGGAAIPAVLAALDAHGVQGGVGDGGAAVARRRLPAPRRARISERRHRNRGGGGMTAAATELAGDAARHPRARSASPRTWASR